MVLEIINVTKNFGKFVLGPLSLTVKNDVMVILGPTGSGKTTLINLIAGILRPDNGKIILNDIDISKHSIEERKVGYVFQDPSLFPHLNVYNNILFGLRRKERESKEKIVIIKKIITDLDIGHLLNRKIDDLSGGEKQKVSLARILVLNPNVILLDEPLSHIDSLARDKLRIELRSILRKQQIPTIYVTHFNEDIYALADSIAFLDRGKIEESGTLEEILNLHARTLSSSLFFNKMISAGNYLTGEVTNCENDLTEFKVGSNMLYTTGNYLPKSKIGVIVKREDIILSREKIKTSARNIVFAKIMDMVKTHNMIDVYLKSSNLNLISRITRSAVEDLGIVTGDSIYAVFKASTSHLIREEKERQDLYIKK
ncbi:MAG: ABC transporter ATP-binding protein [Nitrososphaeraceae archaeon]